jgi:hypothetical protein
MTDTKKPVMARYISKSLKLSLGIKSSYYKEVNGKRETVPGHRVNFEEGMFQTDNPELQELLEKRSEFGTLFIRIPEGETDSDIKERMKPLNEKEKELKQREAELDRREKLLKSKEAGRKETKGEGDESLDGLKREELVTIAKDLGIAPELVRVGIKNEDIKELILKAREEAKDTKAAAFED